MSDEPIISSDTRREERIPPRQVQTRKWPVLHAGRIPDFNPTKWDFGIFPVPLVDAVKRFNWEQFCALPRVKVFADMHCVTRWSLLDNMWEGVATGELLNHVKVPRPREVRHDPLRVRLQHKLADRGLLRPRLLFALKSMLR
ncbi:MAG: molybdopterin-dependent oxidoreductase [Gemmataceae bacterium]